MKTFVWFSVVVSIIVVIHGIMLLMPPKKPKQGLDISEALRRNRYK